jgi:hypothetical protein
MSGRLFFGFSWLWLLLAITGCQHGRPHFYPLGIYGVPSTNDLAVLRETGFNLVSGPAEKSFLDAAQANGMKVLAAPHTSAGPQFSTPAAREAVKQFDGHPALWAWSLIDEPDLNRIPPEDVRRAQRFMKSLPARRPTALVLFKGSEALHYANIADITMIDRYPVPWLPLANFGQNVRQTRLALGRSKPMIAVIQAFDWTCYPELMGPETGLRPPHYEELRCMAYGALAQQATGLFFYAYDDGRWKLHEHPEVWQAVQRVVKEIRQRQPLFLAEHCWWPYDHHFQDWIHRFNAALESSITPCLLRVSKGAGEIPAGDYILAVNTTDQTHVYSLNSPVLPDGGLPVLEEGRQVQVDKHGLTDTFAPYAVHVYGPFTAAKKF